MPDGATAPVTVRRSLVAALGALRTTPSLFAVGLLVAAGQFALVVAQQYVPSGAVPPYSAARTLVSLASVPVMFSGGLALSAAALDGGGDLGTFLAGVRENVLRVSVGTLGVGVLATVLGVVGGLGFVVVGAVVGLAVAGAGGGSAAFTAVVVAWVLWYFLLALPVVAVHFFAHAVTLDGLGLGDAVRRSVGVVRGNLGTAAGYAVVLACVGVVGVLTLLVGSLDGTAPLPAGGSETATPAAVFSPTQAYVIQVVGFAAVILASTVFWPFSVAVYREMRDRVVDDRDDARVTDAGDDDGDTRAV